MPQKIAVVTGGRKGIGRACADALKAEGYQVIVTGRGEAASFTEPNMHYIPCDNTSLASIRAFSAETFARCGRVDVLVNNAGVAPKVRLDLLDTTEESFDFVLDTNLKGTFFLCQTMANRMIEALGTQNDYHPRIINISSVSAYASSVNRGEYCVSKAGISMVTKLFADRLAEYGIPVFEVRPGVIRTDMTSTVTQKYEDQIAKGLTPIPRMGEPKDVANCVSVLASGKLDFATGQVLNADGGFHLRRL